jgi:hypothetical protein
MTLTVESHKKLVPIREAAKILGVLPNTVRRWSDRGLVPHVRQPSGHRMYDPDELARACLSFSSSMKSAIIIGIHPCDAHDIAVFASQNVLIDNPRNAVVHRHYSLTATQSLGRMVDLIISDKYNKILVRDALSWSSVDPGKVLSDLCAKHQVSLVFCNLHLAENITSKQTKSVDLC